LCRGGFGKARGNGRRPLATYIECLEISDKFFRYYCVR
jgi:hypothetical protein